MSRWVGSIYDVVTRHPERQPVAAVGVQGLDPDGALLSEQSVLLKHDLTMLDYCEIVVDPVEKLQIVHVGERKAHDAFEHFVESYPEYFGLRESTRKGLERALVATTGHLVSDQSSLS